MLVWCERKTILVDCSEQSGWFYKSFPSFDLNSFFKTIDLNSRFGKRRGYSQNPRQKSDKVNYGRVFGL